MIFRRNIAGTDTSVESEHSQFIEALEFDFSAFSQLPTSPVGQAISLRAELGPATPPSGLKQTFKGPHGVCFDQGRVRHVLYPGPVWLRYDFDTNEALVVSEDAEALYQRLYLTILSRVGEQLDRRGLHRVHALGLDSPRGGCLILLPSGMGKSTLALPLLQTQGWRLLSEDTPLIDKRGQLYPFPFRLGLRHEPLKAGLPEDTVRYQAPKYLVRADHYSVCTESVKARHVMIGAWSTGPSSLEPISAHGAFSALFRDTVIGVGLPQVAELFLQGNVRDVGVKTKLAVSRLMAVLNLQRRCQCSRLYLGPELADGVSLLTRWSASR